jgi:hypothetical protein
MNGTVIVTFARSGVTKSGSSRKDLIMEKM